MAINVNYSPVGIAGQVANYAGQQQGKAAALQDALRVQGLVQNERQFNKSLQNRVQETQFRTAAQMRTQDKDLVSRRQNLAAQMANQNAQIQYRQEAREREQQFNRMSRLEMLREEEGMRNRLANQDWYRQREQAQVQDEQTKQMFEWKYTQAQKRQQEDLRNKMSWVNAQTNWTDDQKADALSQLESNYLGVQPSMEPVEPPMFPEGREPGMVYEENGFRYTMRMDANGNPYVDELGPIAADETREFDNKPYRQGFGLYQRNRDGSIDTIVAPPELDLVKIYADVESNYKDEQSGFNSEEGSSPKPYDATEVDRRFKAKLKSIREAHSEYIQDTLGMLEGGELSNNPQSPYGVPGGQIGPAGLPPEPTMSEYYGGEGVAALTGPLGSPSQEPVNPNIQGPRSPDTRFGGQNYGYENLKTAGNVMEDTNEDLDSNIEADRQRISDLLRNN